MKSRMIAGLMALQLAVAATAQAQNYYIKVTGDQYTRVADHVTWEQSNIPVNSYESQEAYNLSLANGNKVIGTMLFQSAAGTMSYATHYRLNNPAEQVVARKLLKQNYDNFFVVGEKLKDGMVAGAAVLYYDRTTGGLIKAWDLSTLPRGYKLLHVFDVTSESATPFLVRILCTASTENTEGVMELLFDINSGQYKVIHYKPTTLSLDKYNSVYYIGAHHFGYGQLGNKISFYGMGMSTERKSMAFCYSDNIYEQYSLTSSGGVDEIAGVQMNGSYGPNGIQHEIDMAFLDAEGDICVQQKDFMTTLNWRKGYHLVGGKLRMSMGRDGHGTKSNVGLNYFVTTALHPNFRDPEGRITTLHYDPLSGDMKRPNVWNLSGIGINKAGGFPNNVYDPYANYTFIADRFNQEHGFKFGTGNAMDISIMPCIELYKFVEARNILKEFRAELNTIIYGSYEARPLDMIKVNDIRVEVVPECITEQRGVAQENAGLLLPAANTLLMNTESLRIEAKGKTIVALRLLSIDGRLISEARNINSNSYQQQFARPLVPGIYLIDINYADHSKEVRKVSVQ